MVIASIKIRTIVPWNERNEWTTVTKECDTRREAKQWLGRMARCYYKNDVLYEEDEVEFQRRGTLNKDMTITQILT